MTLSIKDPEADTLARRLLGSGRGSGHPAALNLGGCFGHALATLRVAPLLSTGDDFGHTGLAAALPGDSRGT